MHVAFTNAILLLPSRTHLRPSCPRRPRTRNIPYAAIGTPQSAPRDDLPPPRRGSDSSSSHDSTPGSDPASSPDVDPSATTDADDDDDTPFFSGLQQPELTLDPLTSVPTALVDASGSMQIDDGSFSPSTAVAIPRRLVKRPARQSRVDLASLRRQLAAGFDSGAGAALLLTALFATWYWANTVFNVYNKQVLKVFPYPLTCTVAQFGVAGFLMASLWLSRLKKPPKINWFLLRFAAPLAALHAAGFWLTNMSLGKVSVAFTHTVKSTEPFFSVALTPSILGDVPTWGIVGSLFPIVAGVAIASATDASFNWIGFLSAFGSNMALQSRNVLSKKLMDRNSGVRNPNDKKGNKIEMSPEEEDTLDRLDNVNLFSTMSILAFFLLLPISLWWEGIPLAGAAVSQAVTGMSTRHLFNMVIVGGVCRCLDVLSSYMILKRVSPVTHSVGNCVKRAVVIVVSIFFFKTKMTALSIAGTCLALFGVLVYSLIVSACKQNSFGPDSPMCKPIYEPEMELTEGSGI